MKLFLAATANKPYLQEDYKSLLYALESYYYFKEWQVPLIQGYWKEFMLDSGAFTFRESNARTGKTVDFEAYTYEYAGFINKHDVKLFFEMDVDDVIGIDQVERLRRIMERETGKLSIPVWHIGRGKQYFIDMCKAYPYVAVGGIAGGTQQEYKRFQQFFPWFTATAHQYGAKIHGLGFTPGNVTGYNFDSIDSTTWQSGSRFAYVSKFENGCMHNKRADRSKRLTDYRTLDRYNLIEWMKYQVYLDSEV